MGITIKEKDHWRERIARRIDHAIDELESNEDPSFRQRIDEEAEKKARKSLGLDELHCELRKTEEEIKDRKRHLEYLYKQMLKAIGRSCLDKGYGGGYFPHEVTEAVKRRAKVHQRELMESEPLGKRILQLQKEKEELLDTVWLATSPVQIKELWSRFIELLNWEPPQLQREALEVSPITEEKS